MSYNYCMVINFTESAARHGISEEDALYAATHAVEKKPIIDRRGNKAILFIGPPHGQTNRLIEVIASFDGKDFLIYHAMDTGRRK